MAAEAIDSGRAAAVLQQLVRLSTEARSEARSEGGSTEARGEAGSEGR